MMRPPSIFLHFNKNLASKSQNPFKFYELSEEWNKVCKSEMLSKKNYYSWDDERLKVFLSENQSLFTELKYEIY